MHTNPFHLSNTIYSLSSIAGKDSLTAMATEAAQKALEMAEVDPNDVDLVLLCTSTPEDLFGSAPQVMFPVILCDPIFFVSVFICL